MIRVQNLSITVSTNTGDRTLFERLNFEAFPGEVTTLIGRNGVGKSTLLKSIAGDGRPRSGEIFYGTSNLSNLDQGQVALRRSLMSQHVDSTFAISCAELVEFGTYSAYSQLTMRQRDQICKQTMERLDLNRFAKRSIQTLSGGERQRVYLAKCLVQLAVGKLVHQGAQVLLLDEPTSALDVAQQAGLMANVRQLALEEQLTVICIMHDLNLAAQLSDQIILLKPGGMLAAGAPLEVLTPSLLQKAMGIDFLVQRHPCQNCPLVMPLHGGASPFSNTSTNQHHVYP